MDVRAELSQFLKSRRARLGPKDVGVVDHGRQRRVPGLRREELAQLAGVSVAHYTRLEQGHSENVSAEVLDAVSRTLHLNADETAYLHRLAHPPKHAQPTPGPRLRVSLQRLLDSMVSNPVFVLGHYTNIVAWNRAAAVLVDLAAVPNSQRTWSHQVFLNDEYRQMLGAAWQEFAGSHVAYLRVLLARNPHYAELKSHIAVMREASEEFRRLWNEHGVELWSHRAYVFTHPLVGVLELSGETMLLPGDEDLSELELLVAEPGSASEASLDYLISTTDRKASADLAY
ncbi:helix-turn-helix transcriptional regulator [Streptomyces sp. NBC_01187]|uniref:helix-turn-helix domain-containing protein n=1 Tax=Streptomyces sp. NBC_01187 TaxID=2903766 RepID=UPI002F90E561|nr:helix-turn-helix transcriptional regulator [Streptomyces sp. NBC_01187]WSS46944.1 helix-turn-helix transcriptional regulator [Streptomyces sp. NBC_01187]